MNQGIQQELTVLGRLAQERHIPGELRAAFKQQRWLFDETGTLQPEPGKGSLVGAVALVMGLAMPASAQTFISYTIQPGDTMWEIASRYLGSGARWREIHAWNPSIKNPRKIFAWKKIRIPANKVAAKGKLKIALQPTGSKRKLLKPSGKPTIAEKPKAIAPRKIAAKPKPAATLSKTLFGPFPEHAKPLVAIGPVKPRPNAVVKARPNLARKPMLQALPATFSVEPQFVILSMNGEYKKVVEIVKAKGQRFVHWDTMANIAQLRRIQDNRFVRDWDGKQGTIDKKDRQVQLEGKALGVALFSYKGELYLAESGLGKVFDLAVKWPSDSSILTIESKRDLNF